MGIRIPGRFYLSSNSLPETSYDVSKSPFGGRIEWPPFCCAKIRGTYPVSRRFRKAAFCFAKTELDSPDGWCNMKVFWLSFFSKKLAGMQGAEPLHSFCPDSLSFVPRFGVFDDI